MLKIWEFIKRIIKKIIEWFKNLFKREKTVIFNGKEIVVIKPKFPIAGALMDMASSVIDAKSNSKSPIKIIDQEINKLIKELSIKNEEEVKEIVSNIEEKIEKTRKEIRGSFKDKKIVDKQMAILDRHEQTLKSLKKAYKEDKKDIKKQDDKEIKKDNNDKIVEIMSVNLNPNKQEKEEIKEDVKEEQKEEIKEENIDNTPKKLIAHKEYVKYVNQLLKDGSKLIKQVISEISPLQDMELNKIKIEELKKKIIEIRKYYYDFKHSDYIYVLEHDFELRELDEYEIIKSSEKIDFYLNKCNSVLQTMEYMKSHKEVMQEKVKQDKKNNQENQEKKKNKKEEIPKIILEIEQANIMVIKEIKQQKKEISKFLKKLDTIPIPERRGRKLGFFSNFLNNTLRLGIGFINIFRNRNLSLLTNGYILNNRLRLMRKIVNPNVDIDCITFNRRIKNEIDIINGYQTICNDSLYQITSLKEEFVRCFGYDLDNPELKEVFSKLVDLEENITIQQQNLANAKIKINSKIKVRKFYK